MLEAYTTGRGGFRLRAKWHKEETGRGTYLIVVTEIPYGVQKSRLVEKLAELLTNKKLPLVEDVRDESAEDIRLVIEPKNRTVDAMVLMEGLFRSSELEVRFPLNMNVLSRGQIPNVLSLGQALQEWLDHRKVVLNRRTQNRLKQIAHRLEVLEGYLIAYLNLDEVIRIIRFGEEPKPELMAAFRADGNADRRHPQHAPALPAQAAGNRDPARACRADRAERGELMDLLASDEKQWDRISDEVKGIREKFGKGHPLASAVPRWPTRQRLKWISPKA